METPYRSPAYPAEETSPVLMRPYLMTFAAIMLSFLFGFVVAAVPSCMDTHDAEVRARARRSWVEQWRECDVTCRALGLPTMSRVWTDWGVRCRCGGDGRMVVFPPNASEQSDFTWVRRR